MMISSRVAVYHVLIFCLDYCCADSGLLGVEKAELLERFAHRIYAHALIVCNERRSKADNDRVAALEQDFYFFGLVNYLLCILRTYNKALSAHNTFVADNMPDCPKSVWTSPDNGGYIYSSFYSWIFSESGNPCRYTLSSLIRFSTFSSKK